MDERDNETLSPGRALRCGANAPRTKVPALIELDVRARRSKRLASSRSRSAASSWTARRWIGSTSKHRSTAGESDFRDSTSTTSGYRWAAGETARTLPWCGPLIP